MVVPPDDEFVGENDHCLSATPPAHVHLRMVFAKRDVRAHKEHALGAHLLPFRPRRIADLPWCCAVPPLAIGAAVVGPRHKMSGRRLRGTGPEVSGFLSERALDERSAPAHAL